jgi:D-serine dehydratase
MSFPVFRDALRGIPPELPDGADFPGGGRFRPDDGSLLLPVLTLDRAAYEGNRDALLAYAREHDARLAPHVKTAMIPELALDFVACGGWGATVADVRQAAVMAGAGVPRLLIANEIGGVHGARHLASLCRKYPATEIFVFVDSVATVEALASVWRDAVMARPLPVLAELGLGRAGARDLETVRAVIAAIRGAEQAGALRAAGVASYEGSAVVPDRDETLRRIDGLMALQAEALGLMRAAVADDRRLLVTAGGSLYLDRVTAGLRPAIARDGRADLILRPGAILYGDHGLYQRGIAAMDARGGFAVGGRPGSLAFRPALRVWAQVLSKPEPKLAICGMGMRDVSFDAGFPVPLAVFRDGDRTVEDAPPMTVLKLNDQHAYLATADVDLAVGDIVEFGISHPCTCFDRWRSVGVLDAGGCVAGMFRTCFG